MFIKTYFIVIFIDKKLNINIHVNQNLYTCNDHRVNKLNACISVPNPAFSILREKNLPFGRKHSKAYSVHPIIRCTSNYIWLGIRIVRVERHVYQRTIESPSQDLLKSNQVYWSSTKRTSVTIGYETCSCHDVADKLLIQCSIITRSNYI